MSKTYHILVVLILLYYGLKDSNIGLLLTYFRKHWSSKEIHLTYTSDGYDEYDK